LNALNLLKWPLAVALVFVGAGGFLGWSSDEKDRADEPPVEILLAEEYLDRLLKEMGTAKSKIWVVMYVASYNAKYEFGVQQKIVSMLSKKYKQGVDVRVLLDASYEWDSRKRGYSKRPSDKNEDMMKALKKEGIPVRYDGFDRILHGKWVLIDDDRSILGSHNWTYSALVKNLEASVYLRSKEHQRELAEAFESIWEPKSKP
jgi:phosphatidylserine/phosphatidylglycerophosphate/cardiolipin synthase-like enzyme